MPDSNAELSAFMKNHMIVTIGIEAILFKNKLFSLYVLWLYFILFPKDFTMLTCYSKYLEKSMLIKC